jgi:hypothetical protein
VTGGDEEHTFIRKSGLSVHVMRSGLGFVVIVPNLINYHPQTLVLSTVG